MRPGVVVSIIGHVGAVLMTMLAWEARSELPVRGGAVVPVEIVDVALESNVRALQEADAQDEDVTAEEQTVPEEAETAPASAPTPRPRDRNRDAFEDLLNDPGLIDRSKDRPRPRPTNGQTSDRTQEGAGLGTAEVAALEDRASSMVDRHMARCWRMPDDLPDPERLVVTVAFQVGRNGALMGQPRVISPRNYTFDPPMAEAANRALRAVRQCDPYEILARDPVVGEHYEIWRDQEVTFGRPQR